AAAGFFGPAEAAAQVSTEETWQLARVGEQALPVVTEEHGECRDELHGATLTLHTDGRWTLVETKREVCGGDTDEDVDTDDGRYTISGDEIHFTDDDGDPNRADSDDDELEIDDLVHGARTTEGLTIRVADGDTELHFTR